MDAPTGAPRYFVLASLEDVLAGSKPNAADEQQREIARFINDWTRRCLPLPLCPATTEHVHSAYTFWCRLQGTKRPAPMMPFVVATAEAGFGKGRHRVRPHGTDRVAQHCVIYPPGYGTMKAGPQLDQAASAFSFALKRWRDSTQEDPGAVEQ
jgi:hypothetical protein